MTQTTEATRIYTRIVECFTHRDEPQYSTCRYCDLNAITAKLELDEREELHDQRYRRKR